MRRAGAGRSFPAPGRVASVASAVGGSVGRCARWRGWGGEVGAQRGAAQRGFVSSWGAERLARWPGEAPSASRRTPGQTAAGCGVSAPVCGPEGKGKGHGDVEGEQVRARGTAEAGGSEPEGGRGRARRPSPAVPSVASSRAPPPRACVVCSGGRGGAFRRLGAVTPAGLGGRAGARTGAARGNGRGAQGPRAARAVYLAAPVLAGRPGCGGSASRAAVSVAVGPAHRRPGGRAGGRARQVVPRCSFILTLRGRRRLVPPGSGAAIAICVCNKTTTTTTNLGALRSSLLRCPPPGSPARGAGPGVGGTSPRVSWALRAPRYPLCPGGAPRARGGRTGSRLQWDIFTLSAEDRRITHGAESQPQCSFRCPSWANLPGCPQRSHVPNRTAFL